MKKTQVKTKKQLESYTKNQLFNEMMSMVKTVNSRLRRLKKGSVPDMKDTTYYEMNYDIANRASGILSGEFATASGFMKKPSKKATEEELIIQYLQVQKMYNFRLTTTETKEDIATMSKKMKITKKAVKTALKVQRKGFIEELFRIYGSEIFRIVNNRLAAGQNYEDIIKLLEIADQTSSSVEELFNKFSGEGVWLF